MSIFRFACLILLLIAISPQTAAADTANPFGACRDAKPAWYHCKADADCAIIVTPCGWPNEAANKASLEPAQRCNVEVGASLSCVSYDEKRDGKFRAACSDGQCIAKQIGAAPAPATAPKSTPAK